MQKYIKNIILVLAIPILTLGINAQIVGATAHTLTGTVRDPGNNSVSGAYVYATNPASQAIVYGPVLTNVNGYYSLPIATSGTYDIHFTPPANKIWGPVVESNVAVSTSQTINRNFSSHTSTLSGTLRDGSGNPLPSVTVRIGAYTAATDANGYYSITAPAGNYALSVVGGMSGIATFTLQQSTNGINLSNGDQSLDLSIKTVQMTVQPRNNIGGGLYSQVSARSTSGATQLYPGDPGTNITLANSTTVTPPVAYGPATLTTIMGSTYTASGMESTSNLTSVCTKVPVSSVYDCLRLPMTVKSDVSFDVPSSSPAVRIFSGTLTDGTGTPIPNAQITLVRYGDTTPADTTDANGQFSITAAPKQYSMKIYTNGPLPSLQLTQPAATPGINLTLGDLTQNLQIPTATLTVSVLDSWGGPAYNAPVYAQGNKGTTYLYSGAVGSTISASGETKTTSATSNIVTFNAVIGAQYDANGLNTSNATGSICADIGANWNCIGSPLTISGNTSVTVSQ